MEFIAVDHLKQARAKKKSQQAFYTPRNLVETMVGAISIPPGCTVLEPSSGDGRIVHALLEQGFKVDACEIDPEMSLLCRVYGANMIGSDFLAVPPVPRYHAVVMNPPFSRCQDQRHIQHAAKFLLPGGQLFAIASDNAREPLCNMQIVLADCDLVVFESLPPDQFKESGASPKTILIEIRKAGDSELVEGFCNLATCNSALTITTTFEMAEKAQGLSGPQLRSQFSARIGASGMTCYGVNWDEISDYIVANSYEAHQIATVQPQTLFDMEAA